MDKGRLKNSLQKTGCSLCCMNDIAKQHVREMGAGGGGNQVGSHPEPGRDENGCVSS